MMAVLYLSLLTLAILALYAQVRGTLPAALHELAT